MVNHFAAVQIGCHFNRLADFHFAQLRFFKVGIHPQLRQRHNGHHRRTLHDTLADLDIAFGNLAADRRTDLRTLQIQPSVFDVADGRLNCRLLAQRNIAAQRCLSGNFFRLNRFQCSLSLNHSGASMAEFFSGNRFRTRQRFAAAQIGLRTGQIGFAQQHLRFGF